MKIVMMAEAHKKIMALLRFLLALAVIFILSAQLYGILKNGGFSHNRPEDLEQPKDNPMRVIKDYRGTEGEPDTDKNIFDRLKAYYHGR